MADKSAFVPFDINNAHRDNDGNDVNMDIELFGPKPDNQTTTPEERPNVTQAVPQSSSSPISSNSTTTAVSKPSPKKFEYKKPATYKKTIAK